jgi:hypothetical protein
MLDKNSVMMIDLIKMTVAADKMAASGVFIICGALNCCGSVAADSYGRNICYRRVHRAWTIVCCVVAVIFIYKLEIN